MKTMLLVKAAEFVGDDVNNIIEGNLSLKLTPETEVVVIEFKEGADVQNSAATVKILTASTLNTVWVA